MPPCGDFMTTCIWCLGRTDDNDVEHIFPASLGCPDNLTLPGTVVCRACNSGLADLDKAVADEFDFAAFMAHVPRKRGRPPEIASRGNVHGFFSDKGSELHFNIGRQGVAPKDGKWLAPFRGGPRDIKPTIERKWPFIKASFEIPFGQSPKFIRGIYKAAFSCFAFLAGPEVARSAQFQEIRDFVRFGKGIRHLIVTTDPYENFTLGAYPPWVSAEGFYSMPIRIAQIHFLADLSPGEVLFPQLRAKKLELYGPNGWTTLPTEDSS